MGKFICIVGMDGSGKTTLTRNTVAELARLGIDAHYVYGRFQPVLARPVMAILRPALLRGQRGPNGHQAYAQRRRRAFANPVLYAGYQALLSLDYAIQVVWRIAIPRLRGRTLVCDRYYIDTVAADVAIDTTNPGRTLSRMLRLYRRLLPKPDVFCMTDVPGEIAYSRKADIPSPRYADDLRCLYLRAAELCGVQVLDGTEAPETLVQKVIEASQPHLARMHGMNRGGNEHGQ